MGRAQKPKEQRALGKGGRLATAVQREVVEAERAQEDCSYK